MARMAGRRAVVVCAVSVVALGGWVIAGDLNPPAGPVAPTMKTLEQIEPRIEINAVNTPGDAFSLYKITAPGSYYLTGNLVGEPLKNGISVQSNDVTIDLCGFTLLGAPSSEHGIRLTAARNVTIRNGAIRGWGADGISVAIAGNGRVEHIRASGNGQVGIRVSDHFTVADCSASDNGGGILTLTGSVVARCTATDNDTSGIAVSTGSTVTDSTAAGNGGAGFSIANDSVISGCSAFDNGGVGIQAVSGSIVSHCASNNNAGYGISVFQACLVRNCVSANNSSGIHTGSTDNRIEGNRCAENAIGYEVGLGGNFIARNIATGNTTNWSISSLNICLIVNATPSGAISGTTGGVGPGSTDPNANFTY